MNIVRDFFIAVLVFVCLVAYDKYNSNTVSYEDDVTLVEDDVTLVDEMDEMRRAAECSAAVQYDGGYGISKAEIYMSVAYDIDIDLILLFSAEQMDEIYNNECANYK